MLDYPKVLNAILPVYLMMLAGGFARRIGLLPREADAGLMRLSINLLFPCLILVRLVGNAEVLNPGRVLGAAALGYGLVGLGILTSYALAPLLGLKVGEGRRTFAMAVGIQNYGFVAIPVISTLFPGDATLGVMFTFTLGVELAVWTLGVGVLTGMKKAPWRAALNVPVISIVVALVLNFAGLHHAMPVQVSAPLTKVMSDLGGCSVPLSVLLIGASICDLWGKERLRWSVAIGAPLLRLIVIPIAFYAAAWLLPLTLDLKRIIVIQGAMPSAVFGIVLAKHYGGHASTAVQVVLATTVGSLLTTPFAIRWVVEWLHLGN